MYRCINPLTIIRNGAVDVPCGECYPCQMRKRAEWDLRLLIEALYSQATAFVTYTYADEYIDHAHQYGDFQLLHKRMRNNGLVFTFYHVSEFGEMNGRPHSHELLFFKHPFDTRYLYSYAQYGIMDVGTLTPASVHYVCKWHVHPKYRSGESLEKHGFTRMSKGLGSQLTFTSDNFTPTYSFRGDLWPVSRYYRKKSGVSAPDTFISESLWERYHAKFPFVTYDDYKDYFRRLFDYNLQKQHQIYGNL